MKFEKFNGTITTKMHGGVNFEFEKTAEQAISDKDGKKVGTRKFFRLWFDSPSKLAIGNSHFITETRDEDTIVKYPPNVKEGGGNRLQFAAIVGNRYANGKFRTY